MLEKSSTSYLGPGCREFESRHSDQNRQFSLRKLAVLNYSPLCFLSKLFNSIAIRYNNLYPIILRIELCCGILGI